MGTRYEIYLKCPSCRKKTIFYNASSCGTDIDKCEHCGAEFRIGVELIAGEIE